MHQHSDSARGRKDSPLLPPVATRRAAAGRSAGRRPAFSHWRRERVCATAAAAAADADADADAAADAAAAAGPVIPIESFLQ